jgi:transcriptional regulator with XRE-family HTH domain
MPDNQQILGKLIQRLRIAKGLSQEGLAALANVERSFVGKIERGESSPSFTVLLRIARGLSIPLSELIRIFESETENSKGHENDGERR